MLEGPAPALWTFFAAVAVIFIVVLWILIRGRVIAPARRKATNPQFFEPAGADADITFDAPDAAAARKETSNDRTHSAPAPEEAGASDVGEPEPAPKPEIESQAGSAPAPEARPEQKKSRSPFAGLFKKKRTERPAPEAQRDEEQFAEIEIATETGPHEESQDYINAEGFDDRFAAEETEPRRYAHAPAEDARETADWRRDEAAAAGPASDDGSDALARAYERQAQAEAAAREAEFERRKAEAALELRMQTLAAMERENAGRAESDERAAKAMEGRLNASLEERFAALSHELNARLESVAGAQADPDLARSVAAEVAHVLAQDMNLMHRSMHEAFAAVIDRLDAIDAAAAEETERPSPEEQTEDQTAGAPPADDARDALLDEIDALRRRVAALEDTLEHARAETPPPAAAQEIHPFAEEADAPPPEEANDANSALAESVEDAFERLQQEEALAEARRDSSGRPVFPLRSQD